MLVRSFLSLAVVVASSSDVTAFAPSMLSATSALSVGRERSFFMHTSSSSSSLAAAAAAAAAASTKATTRSSMSQLYSTKMDESIQVNESAEVSSLSQEENMKKINNNNNDNNNNNENDSKSKMANMMKPIKEAGPAGALSLFLWAGAFWVLSIPVCSIVYYQATGSWPDWSQKEDVAKVTAEAFAFANIARFALPVRIGLAISTTPWVKENIVDRFGLFQQDNQEEGTK